MRQNINSHALHARLSGRAADCLATTLLLLLLLGQRRGRWCLLATHQESHGHDARHESRRTLSCCESRVCGCSFFSGSTCCSPTPLPFTCERSITTLRHTNQTEHAKKRHGRQQNTRFVASSHGSICSCSATHSMPLLPMCSFLCG